MSETVAGALAANLATQFEGFRAAPYQDSVGVWTIGYGSTHDAKGQPITAAHPPITEPTARAWLVDDMQLAFADIQREVKVPITADETAALEDFVYNLGQGAFNGSTLLKMLNARDYAGAAEQLLLWDHAGGVVLAGLLRRRHAEMNLFNQPDQGV